MMRFLLIPLFSVCLIFFLAPATGADVLPGNKPVVSDGKDASTDQESGSDEVRGDEEPECE